MLVNFDKMGMVERPVLTLAYPQRTELGQLGSYTGFSYDPVLQSYSSINFRYPFYAQNGERSNFYDEIQNQMLIKAEGLGEFIITNCEEENDGAKKYKQITANSAEYQLCKRKINLLNGTYNLKELLDKLFEVVPSWSTGHISAELSTKYRTFDVPDSTLYDFLINEVAKTYECIFVFDTINRKVNAYVIDELIKESDIYVGYGNFLKSEKIEEISDELVTVLSCYGGDGVNIASVNPTGTVSLYNFDHYIPMMSKTLQDKLKVWKEKYNSYIEPCKYNKDDIYIEGTGGLYSNLLRQIKEQNAELIRLRGNLAVLDMRRKALEDVQAVKIAGGRVNDTQASEIEFNEKGDKILNEEEISYKSVVEELSIVKKEMAGVENEIKVIEETILKLKNNPDDPQNKGMKQINEELAFKDGDIFSEEDLKELDYFKFESTHQDDNYIVTDAMNLVEEQDMIQQLYDSCVELMKTVSRPTYNITADSVNFLFIEKLAPYINKIYDPGKPETLKQLLGVRFHLEISEDNWLDPVLLKFHVNFDDPTDFSMEFSNKYRLNSAIWTYGDLMGEAVSATGSMSFDYSSIKAWNSHRNELLDFANNSLDMTRNSLVNNTENQTFLIDNTGLRGHSSNKEDETTRKGIWLTADTLAFTDDNWQTVKTAVGLIHAPNNEKQYGINTEVLIGKMVLGNNLVISAGSDTGTKTMTMDGTGLSVTTDYHKILLNPTEGIKVQKKNGSSYDDKFYIDSNTGDVVLTGKITATSGEIAGFTISDDGANPPVYTLSSDGGKIKLRSDGTATIGMMEVGKTSTTFNGNIYARNILYGKQTINGERVDFGTLDGGAITSNSITYNEIAGNTITIQELDLDGDYGVQKYFDGIYATSATVGTLIAEKGYITAADVGDLVAKRIKSGNFTIDEGKTLAWSTGCSLTSTVSVGKELVLTVSNTLKTTTVRCTNLYINNTLVRKAASPGQVPSDGYVLYIE